MLFRSLPSLSEPSDEDYWVKKPTYAEYYSRCNEFWWVAPYCAKGLWRHEILYTIEILNSCVREELLNMIGWQVGIQTDFQVSVGKANKYLKDYLEEELWKRLLITFNMSNEEAAWHALITTCELFAEIAPRVGEALQYEYNHEEARKSFEFIKHIRTLPEDITEIY